MEGKSITPRKPGTPRRSAERKKAIHDNLENTLREISGVTKRKKKRRKTRKKRKTRKTRKKKRMRGGTFAELPEGMTSLLTSYINFPRYIIQNEHCSVLLEIQNCIAKILTLVKKNNIGDLTADAHNKAYDSLYLARRAKVEETTGLKGSKSIKIVPMTADMGDISEIEEEDSPCKKFLKELLSGAKKKGKISRVELEAESFGDISRLVAFYEDIGFKRVIDLDPGGVLNEVKGHLGL